jgi:prepilin-type N-terminal cleavage/methylation domain-containing protein
MPLKKSEAGFTLLELLIVIVLIAGVYAIAFPNFSMQQNSKIADSLARLSEDVRAAYDTTVLLGKPHRIVFKLATGDYTLQRSEQTEVYLSDEAKEGAEASPQQAEEKRAAFDEQFAEYSKLAGEGHKAPSGDDIIPAVSPVLKAKNLLRDPVWQKAELGGWTTRNIGDFLQIKDVQTEHNAKPITLEEAGENGVAIVHFFPRGYVERTVMHIYIKDSEQPPYTVLIDPNLGTAEVRSGYEEIDVRAAKK